MDPIGFISKESPAGFSDPGDSTEITGDSICLLNQWNDLYYAKLYFADRSGKKIPPPPDIPIGHPEYQCT